MDNSQPAVTQEPVPGSSSALRISRARGMSYRVPAEVTTRGAKYNFVVELTAHRPDGSTVVGLGEGQPRGWRTGDAPQSSWNYLTELTRRLEGLELPLQDLAGSLQAVRDLTADFSTLAEELSLDPEHVRPFRGTLLGVEVALLDLLSRAHGLPLAQLLGQRREEVIGVPETLRLGDSTRWRPEAGAEADGRYRRINLRPEAADTGVMAFVGLMNTVERRIAADQRQHKLWIDFDRSLESAEAEEFVRLVVAAAAEGTLPGTILIEQPVRASEGLHLAQLQRLVDAEIPEDSQLDVRIMGDESVWDEASLERLDADGGLRAINIRPAQVGGLLAAVDLAEEALRRHPDTEIFLSRMVGGSRLTAGSLRHLALALPRIDEARVIAVVENALPLTDVEYLSVAGERAADEPGDAEGLDAAEERSVADGALRESEDTDDDDDGEQAPSSAPAAVSAASAESAESDSDDDEDSEDLEEPGFRQFGHPDAAGLGVVLTLNSMVGEIENMVSYPAQPVVQYEGLSPTIYDDVDNLHPLGPNGSKGHLLEREALALGLNTIRYSKGAFTATDGEHPPIPFKWSRNPLSSAVSLALCTHKEGTRLQLQRSGVPVPQGRTFTNGDFTTAKAFAQRIGYPVVVKPAMGVRGIGVVAGIQDDEQLDAAFELMSGSKLGNQDFIVEKHVSGRDYRIVVIGDRVVAAILREPASVFGDGKRTVAELMIDKNVARRRNPHLWARPAKYDAAARYELHRAGLTLESVPEPGRRVQLANTCSLSQGGDSVDVLDEMHPSIIEACVKTVRSIPGLEYCGVDFLLEDHTRPLDEQDAGICELNAHAAIGNCEYPMYGTPRPVARTLMRAVVDHYGLRTADEPAAEITVKVQVRGKVTGVGYRRWLRRRALHTGVSGWVRNVDDKTMETVLSGPTAATTALVASLILGPKRALPTTYAAEHLPHQSFAGFEIRDAEGTAGTEASSGATEDEDD